MGGDVRDVHGDARRPAPYECPRETVLLAARRRTATGGLQRFRLRTAADADADTDADTDGDQQ
ncbi:hypothetical protein [Streptomyces sp. NPDC088812]|uniref:hypothetical protein n=1 Tax=Streptomyces sp. NPDC088812 TaxID=3365905 RepID=UPI0037F5B67F